MIPTPTDPKCECIYDTAGNFSSAMTCPIHEAGPVDCNPANSKTCFGCDGELDPNVSFCTSCAFKPAPSKDSDGPTFCAMCGYGMEADGTCGCQESTATPSKDTELCNNPRCRNGAIPIPDSVGTCIDFDQCPDCASRLGKSNPVPNEMEENLDTEPCKTCGGSGDDFGATGELRRRTCPDCQHPVVPEVEQTTYKVERREMLETAVESDDGPWLVIVDGNRDTLPGVFSYEYIPDHEADGSTADDVRSWMYARCAVANAAAQSQNTSRAKAIEEAAKAWARKACEITAADYDFGPVAGALVAAVENVEGELPRRTDPAPPVVGQGSGEAAWKAAEDVASAVMHFYSNSSVSGPDWDMVRDVAHEAFEDNGWILNAATEKAISTSDVNELRMLGTANTDTPSNERTEDDG